MDRRSKVAITGSSGLLGREVVRQFRSSCPGAEILGIDVVPPNNKTWGEECPDQFQKVDITVATDVEGALESFLPDTVIHLAFIVDPMRDTKKMRKINIDGTKHVLQACAKLKVNALLVASSASAYGAWSTNPPSIPETQPVKPHPDYQYASEKAEIDVMTQNFAKDNPDMLVSLVRPCIVLGPNINNFIARSLLDPVQMEVWGSTCSLQFVDVEDVAGAILSILLKKARGPFNVAPPDALTRAQIAAPNNVVTLPYYLLWVILFFCWWLEVGPKDAPPGILDFSYYPWVVDPKRLTDELGFRFKYSSAQTLANWKAKMAGVAKKDN